MCSPQRVELFVTRPDQLLPFLQGIDSIGWIRRTRSRRLPSEPLLDCAAQCSARVEHACVKKRVGARIRTHVLRAWMRKPQDGRKAWPFADFAAPEAGFLEPAGRRQLEADGVEVCRSDACAQSDITQCDDELRHRCANRIAQQMQTACIFADRRADLRECRLTAP